ncbi:MAG TPA: short-chain dehydrogenase/reductase [Myxococcota bacterium]|nr:short-chain dehydrogenase/reductase [Myxococcota bacterium]
MDLGLRGKSVLVTGSSKGIGLACARSFAAEGANVHLAARSSAPMHAAARELAAKFGVELRVHPVDLRASDAAERLAGEAGELDVLVNNAGDIPRGGLAAVDEATWRHAWDLKVFGFINLTRAVLARMESRGRGVIVNVIGMAGVGHPADYICGAAGNAALEAFTKAAGKGSTKSGVRVLGLHPGATRTDRLADPLKALARQRFGDESRWEELLRGVAIQEPEQVADTVVFLASERASHLSGVVLNLTPA